MNRKLRTTVPISRDLRMATVPDYSAVAEEDMKEKQKQADNYNQRDAAKEVPTPLPGDTVYLTDRRREGTVLSETTPRSFTLFLLMWAILMPMVSICVGDPMKGMSFTLVLEHSNGVD